MDLSKFLFPLKIIDENQQNLGQAIIKISDSVFLSPKISTTHFIISINVTQPTITQYQPCYTNTLIK